MPADVLGEGETSEPGSGLAVLDESTVLARTGCTCLEQVRSLSCYGMRLVDVSIASRLVSCEMISLVSNSITSLAPFSSCHALVELFLRRNAIAEPAELRHLSQLRWLSTLWLAQNPIAAMADYRRTVRAALPQLKQLDNSPLDDADDGTRGEGAVGCGGDAAKSGWALRGPSATPPLVVRWGEEEEDEFGEGPEEDPRRPADASSDEERAALKAGDGRSTAPPGEDAGELPAVPAGAALGAARALLSPGSPRVASPWASCVSSIVEAVAGSSADGEGSEAGREGGAGAEGAFAPPNAWAEPRTPLPPAAQRAPGAPAALADVVADAGSPAAGSPAHPGAQAPGEAAPPKRKGSNAVVGAAQLRKPPRPLARRVSADAATAGRDGAGGLKPPRSKSARLRKVEAGDVSGRPPRKNLRAEVRAAALVSGKRVWCAERDGCIVVRDGSSCEVVERMLCGIHHSILSLAQVGDAVWAGTQSGAILIYAASSRELRAEVRHHSGGVHCIAASRRLGTPTGFAVSGSADFKVVMHDPATAALKKRFAGHSGAVRAVVVLGINIWSGADDHTIRVWDGGAGLFGLGCDPCVACLTGHSAPVTALLPHGGCVLSASADGTVRAWDAAGSHECMRSVALACGLVSLAPMGANVWAAGQDGAIYSLHGTSLTEAAPPREGAHSGYVTGMLSMRPRVRRTCWSFSLADESAQVWAIDEVEGEAGNPVAAAALSAQVVALDAQLAERSADAAQAQAEAESWSQRANLLAVQGRDREEDLLGQLAEGLTQQEADMRAMAALQHELEAMRARAEVAEAEAQAERRARESVSEAAAREAQLRRAAEVAARAADARAAAEAALAEEAVAAATASAREAACRALPLAQRTISRFWRRESERRFQSALGASVEWGATSSVLGCNMGTHATANLAVVGTGVFAED